MLNAPNKIESNLDYLLPGYWNPDICVTTSAMNRPRLFTHWVPRLQTLNESSLSKLRQQPTNSRLTFIDDYLESARRDQDKEYTSVSLGPEPTHARDKSARPSPGENIPTGVTSPSCTDSGPPSRHLPCPVIAALILPSQSSDLDSPTNSSPTLRVSSRKPR